jgi:hypothetical protein
MRSLRIIGQKKTVMLSRILVQLQMPLRLRQPKHHIGILFIQPIRRRKPRLRRLPVLLLQIEAAHIQIFLDQLLPRLVLHRLPRPRIAVVLRRQRRRHPLPARTEPIVRDHPRLIRRPHRVPIRVRIPSRRRSPSRIAASMPATGIASRIWPILRPRSGRRINRNNRRIRILTRKRIVATTRRSRRGSRSILRIWFRLCLRLRLNRSLRRSLARKWIVVIGRFLSRLLSRLRSSRQALRRSPGRSNSHAHPSRQQPHRPSPAQTQCNLSNRVIRSALPPSLNQCYDALRGTPNSIPPKALHPV